MDQIAHVLAIQTYDFITKTGGHGSKARIEAACRLIRENKIPERVLAVFPQGYQQAEPHIQKDLNRESLGHNIANHLEDQVEMGWATIVVRPISWGTQDDIKACYKIVEEQGYDQAHFYFVTDAAHLRRVKLVWYLTHPPGWTASFYPALEHRRPNKERWIYEPLAFLKYLFDLLPSFLHGLRDQEKL